MNSRSTTEVKQQEYDLLGEIARDSLVTQSNLSDRLGMAVGSVNWYIKRLITRGWVKVSHLDRTRLKYDLTPAGMKIFTQRAMLYRQKAKSLAAELKQAGVQQVYLDGEDEWMDILRLTCLEAGLVVSASPTDCVLEFDGANYRRKS